jgi:hypothetical protein
MNLNCMRAGLIWPGQLDDSKDNSKNHLKISLTKNKSKKTCFFKKILRQKHSGSTQVNLQNPWSGSWDQDNLIESKSKPNMKPNSQLNKCWRMNLKKIQLKKTNNSSQLGLTCQICNPGHVTEINSI